MRSLLGRALASIEEVFDAQKLKRHAADDILIVPYLGFGDGETAYVQGRVLFDNHIVPPTESDSLWTNLVNTWRRFESDEIPGARVRVTLFDSTQDCVTDEEGYFKAELHPRLPVVDDTAWCKVTVDLLDTPIDSDKTASAVGYVIIPPPDAQFAVVSDLDDTVMRTDVLNRLKMIHNTFLRNAYSRLPFEGVAAFYRALQAGTTQTTNPIFYVSSSPWNLYDAILDIYRIRHIPRGPIFLRDLGLHTKGNTAPGHHEHKMGHIRRLLETYTHLPFILIGDSGQKDPRIYLETIRRYPGRI